MLSEAHKQQLQLKYGLPGGLISSLEDSGEISSLSPSEVRDHLGRNDIDSTGFLIRYPGNGASTVRLDNPPVKGSKPQKYLRRSGEPNHLFNPGVEISQAQELWVVEGELKALCGHAQGLPVVALSGVYNWRTSGPEVELLGDGEKLKDEEALLPELAQVNWSGKRINLLYDSDIAPGHKAYDAFPRLAEQLYRLGAEEVKILSLPSLSKDSKTGLDDFILAKSPRPALQDLRAMKDRREPYLPIGAGGLAYAERLIKSQNLEDKQRAAIAILGAKGEFIAGAWLKEHGLLQKDITLLLRAAKESLKELQAKPRTSSRSQEDLPELGPEYDTPKALLQAAGEYSLDKLGRLCKEESKFNENTGELIFIQIPLCNFICWPIREILKDSGNGTPDQYLELQGLLQGGAPLLPRKVSLTDFLEKPSSWAGLAWGAKAAIKPFLEKEARYAIQLMAQDIPTTTIYTHLGWRKIGDSWVYLHAGGAVGSEAVEVEISDRLRKYSLPNDKGDIQKALQASLSILELGPKRIMYPLYSLIWLAPLCDPLRRAGIEPGFVSYIWGSTGIFKSTIIALLLSHYGNFESKGLPSSFRDTPKSIEEMAFLAKDTLLVVDDLYPAKDPRERAKLEGVLEYLSRNQGDRQGRGRLKSTSDLMAGHPPRGLALCSGETMPLGGSSLARNLVLHLQKEDINQEKLTIAQDQKGLFSQAMRGFLEYLAPQLDILPSDLSKDFEHLRKQADITSKTRSRHRRLNETVAFLYLGFHVFLNYAVSQEALSQEKAVKLLQEAWKTLNQVADDLAQIAEREEPTKRFFEALLELQTLGRVYFATMEDVKPDLAEQTLGAVKIGWGPDEKGVYYLLYGPAWEAVVKYLRTQEEGLSLSKDSLLDAIEQKGLLDRHQGKRRSIVKKIAGNPVRVLPILEKAFSLEEGKNEV